MTSKEQKAWNKFMITGAVADYLNYKSEENAAQQTAKPQPEGEQTLGADHNGWLGAQAKKLQ